MIPPTKDQADIGIDNPTVDASDGPENKDVARQEFKLEADINYMLSRFGITQPRGTPTYGEVDDSIDLQIAIEAVRDAREGFNRLDPELRSKFSTMEELLTAINSGGLVISNEEAPPPPVDPIREIQDRLKAAEEALKQANATT